MYGLLLEDVGGLDLTKFDPSMGDYVSLGHSLMAAVFTFPAYGVLHRDIRSPNILISPPSRISIIDFGHAKIRTSDEEWKQEVQEEQEIAALRFLLNKRCVRDRSPFDTRYRGPQHRIRFFNNLFHANVAKYPAEWRRRWYNEVPQTVGANQEGISLWLLREEVAAWLDARPPPPQGFLTSRPGSPTCHASSVGFVL